jgi:cell division protein ZapA
MSAPKKTTIRVGILGEEYSLRTEMSSEDARAVARHLDDAIRRVMSSGTVVESYRAVVLAALQVTAELFEEKEALRAATEAMDGLSEVVRPLLPPSKRNVGGPPSAPDAELIGSPAPERAD